MFRLLLLYDYDYYYSVYTPRALDSGLYGFHYPLLRSTFFRGMVVFWGKKKMSLEGTVLMVQKGEPRTFSSKF